MQKDVVEHCKLAVIGNVDSGKSTLVGVLTKGLPDDGRGAARLRVFNYPHQVQTGRTSSVCHEIMGFDQKGNQILPQRFNPNKNKYWKEVVPQSKKIVTFFDLCGHQKYLKTTINGLTGLIPDYSMIIVGSNMGVSKMTREHLGISLFLKIPFIIILTKIDIAPKNVYDETILVLQKILKSKLVQKLPILIKQGTSKEQILKYAQTMPSAKICPIFSVSSVSNTGLPQLVYFISKLNNRDQLNNLIKSPEQPLQFDTNQVFVVQGVGIVVSGIVKAGTGKINQHCFLGPDKNKTFKVVVIKSIHVNRVPRDEASSGEFACFNIRPLKANQKLNRNDFRKGMVLVDISLKPQPIWQFQAEVQVLHHATTITSGYQAVLHCGVIRQCVHLKRIYNNQEGILRNQDRGIVRFRFMYNPQYLKSGLTILLRQGRTKILGNITKIFHEKDLSIQQQKQNQKENKKEVRRQQREKNQKKDIKQIIQKKKFIGNENKEKKQEIKEEHQINQKQ